MGVPERVSTVNRSRPKRGRYWGVSKRLGLWGRPATFTVCFVVQLNAGDLATMGPGMLTEFEGWPWLGLLVYA